MVTAFLRAARRFGGKDDGSASVEALFWIPAFLAVFALMVDISFIYHNEARMQRILQDTNRNISINRFQDATAAEAYINARLASLKITPKTVSVSIETVDDPTSSDPADVVNTFVITEIVVEAKRLQMVGLYSALLNSDVTVLGVHVSETAPFDFFDSMGVATTS